MDELIRDHLVKVLSLIGIVVASVIGGLYKLGWLRPRLHPRAQWDGKERRECSNHPQLTKTVCSLYTKLDELDKKLDTVSEKLQWVLGALEARWGNKIDK